MPRISKIETYAILWLNNQGLDIAEISKELKIAEKSVISTLEKNNNTNIDKIKTGSRPSKKNDDKKSLMINETSIKKNKSVSIMTEAASQKNDEVVKNMRNENSNNNIFRPNNG